MLDKSIAQAIVTKVMEVTPYNINIMNKDGEIIASGDSSRIGDMHHGALKALEAKDTVEVFELSDKVKPGVNTPIFFRNRIIGAIGITGDPEEVRHFSKLISITAELLIGQEYNLNQSNIKEKIKNTFINEWLNFNYEYDEDLINRGKSLDIDITLARTIVLIETKDKNINIIDKYLKNNEYSFHISNNKVALILVYTSDMNKRVQALLNILDIKDIKAAIGKENTIISLSLTEAITTLEIGKKLYPDKNIYLHNEMKFFSLLKNMSDRDIFDEVFFKIKDNSRDDDLVDTFLTYFELNGEKNKIAEKLHIHRNTLNYRLEKIEELTDLKLNNFLDLYKLLSTYVLSRLKI